ncbi:cathelicidin-2-like [Lepisosteus oculatus]|uniref:cathelicidin-2-like n=1 Tax=Lepisosteus oculatus TaxID=7918 RepID=UPI00371D47FE
MRTSVEYLLLLCMAAVATVSLAKKTFSYMDALSAATAHYNQESVETNAFKPPKVAPLKGMSMFIPGDGSGTEYTIRFILKETVCPKLVDYGKEECDFKENGSLKKCTGLVTVVRAKPGEANAVVVTCEEVTDPEERKKLEEPPSWWYLFGRS